MGTPPGSKHARNDAVTPAKPLNSEKRPNPFAKLLSKLSLRERIMVAVLTVAIIVSAVAYFVVLPALTTISDLETEIVVLQEEKASLLQKTDYAPDYRNQFELALKDYENYQRFYYPFMDPETIDRTITNMLLDNDLEPIRFSMSAITREVPPMYVEQPLVPKPVPPLPTPEEAAQSAGAAGNAAGTGTDASDANADATGADGAQTDTPADPNDPNFGRSEQLASDALAAGVNAGLSEEEGQAASAEEIGLRAGTSIYCYTVDVDAHGWMDNLYSFLAQAKGITAVDVVLYNYVPPAPVTPTNPLSTPTSGAGNTATQTQAAPTTGFITIQLKLYVFVEGGVIESYQAMGTE
jgi:hypothetical protein